MTAKSVDSAAEDGDDLRSGRGSKDVSLGSEYDHSEVTSLAEGEVLTDVTFTDDVGDDVSDEEMEAEFEAYLEARMQKDRVQQLLEKPARLRTSLQQSLGHRGKRTKLYQPHKVVFSLRLFSVTEVPAHVLRMSGIGKEASGDAGGVRLLERGVVVRWERGKKKGASKPAMFATLSNEQGGEGKDLGSKKAHAVEIGEVYWSADKSNDAPVVVECEATLFLNTKEQMYEDKDIRLTVLVPAEGSHPEQLIGETVLNLAPFAEVGDLVHPTVALACPYPCTPLLHFGVLPEFISGGAEMEGSPFAKGASIGSVGRRSRGRHSMARRSLLNLTGDFTSAVRAARAGGAIGDGAEKSTQSPGGPRRHRSLSRPLSSLRTRSATLDSPLSPEQRREYSGGSISEQEGERRDGGGEGSRVGGERVSGGLDEEKCIELDRDIARLEKELDNSRKLRARQAPTTCVELFSKEDIEKKEKELSRLLAEKVLCWGERQLLGEGIGVFHSLFFSSSLPLFSLLSSLFSFFFFLFSFLFFLPLSLFSLLSSLFSSLFSLLPSLFLSSPYLIFFYVRKINLPNSIYNSIHFYSTLIFLHLLRFSNAPHTENEDIHDR